MEHSEIGSIITSQQVREYLLDKTTPFCVDDVAEDLGANLRLKIASVVDRMKKDLDLLVLPERLESREGRKVAFYKVPEAVQEARKSASKD